MAYTQADLDSIDKAILDLAIGKRVSSLTIDGEVTTFSDGVSLSQLQNLHSIVKASLSSSHYKPRTFARSRR